jgi:hypothetical protein
MQLKIYTTFCDLVMNDDINNANHMVGAEAGLSLRHSLFDSIHNMELASSSPNSTVLVF